MSGCSSVAEVWVPAPRRTIHRVRRQNQLCLGVSCLSSQVDALPITKSGKRDIQAIEHLGHQKWARFAQCCLASAFAVGYTECEFGVVPKAACGWLGQDREGAAFAISEGSSTCIVFIAYLYHEVIEYNSEEEQLVAAAFNEACWTKFLCVETCERVYGDLGVGWATLCGFMATWRCARFWGDKWHARCPSWRCFTSWLTMTRWHDASRHSWDQAGGHSLSAMRRALAQQGLGHCLGV